MATIAIKGRKVTTITKYSVRATRQLIARHSILPPLVILRAYRQLIGRKATVMPANTTGNQNTFFWR